MTSTHPDPYDDPSFYGDLGLICGLEIHQQLRTEGKLFCRCPAGKYSKEYDAVVLRHMRPTLSEMGTYDGTALMEFKTRKEIVYLLHDDSVCTYEMDDTPPFPVDENALDISIVLSLTMGSPVVDELHIARKQYLDGSIPTGFQRTGIVGLASEVPFRGRKVRIRQISLEEDSCREVDNKGHRITFRTDRLGMPLVEVVTDPDFRTPREAARGARLLGRIMRATGLVRTGLGTTRQDVNVSVTGGVRCEIKGVSRYQLIPPLVHNEALRQANLLAVRKELHLRGIKSPAELVLEERDVTESFLHSGPAQPAGAARRGEAVRAVVLKGLAGILSMPTQEGYHFVSELKGRVRVVACLDEPPILYDSEHWPGESRGVLEDLCRRLAVGEKDALVLVWGPKRDTLTAAGEIRLRLEEAIYGVPNETRKPLPDGHTDFERILPGPDRMYPDTDHPVIPISRDRVRRLASLVPAMPWEREEKWRRRGLPEDAVERIAVSPYEPLLDRLAGREGADPRALGLFVARDLRGLRREGLPAEELSPEELEGFFLAVFEGGIAREAWTRWFRRFLRAREEGKAEEILEEIRSTAPPSGEEIEAALEKALSAPFTARARGSRFDWYMGRFLKELKGRIPGRKAAALLEEKLAGEAGR